MFTVTGDQILLIRLTHSDGGTMVVSQKALSLATRNAIEEAINEGHGKLPLAEGQNGANAEWSGPFAYYSHEIQGDSFTDENGLTVYFEGDTVRIPHKVSSHEVVLNVIYTTESATNSFTIQNHYFQTLTGLDIIKYERGNSEKYLQGATFELRKFEDIAPATGGTLSYVTDNNNNVIVTPKTSGTDGKLTFDGLTYGFYEIKEVTPPPGYILAEDIVVYLKVDGEGKVTCIAKDDGTKPSQWITATLSADPLIFKAATDNENASVKVGNTPGMELPSTGGPGTNLFLILGSVLALGAASGALIFRRRIA